MMEVKQNTAVDLNDLLASSKSNASDDVDDAVMEELTDRSHNLHCEIIKSGDKTSSVVCIGNGNVDMSSAINDVEVDSDINVPVNPELEDALLAGEDILPKLDSKKIEPVSGVAEDDILADKVETSNSTTSSSNLRDPGDDLDTLLSKINDIVEDCIETEVENNVVSTDKLLESRNIPLESSCVKSTNLSDGVTYNSEAKIDDVPEKMNVENSEGTTSKETPVVTPTLPVPEKAIENEEKEHHDVDNETINSITDISMEKGTCSTSPTNVMNESKIEETEQEKTEHCNIEAVQDNEITSNSNENLDDLLNPPPGGIVKTDGIKSPIIEVKLNDTENNINRNDDKKTSVEDIKASEQNENEDSDDEIVFYVDKPPETKEKISKGEEKTVNTEQLKETATEENDVSKSQPGDTSTKIRNQDDDDVVLLLDDDEDEANPLLKEKQSKRDFSEDQEESKNIENDKPRNEEVAVGLSKDIHMDNSDNARDDFVSEKSKDGEKIVNKTVSPEAPEEANSNCSSSSNLLQEAKSVDNTAEEPLPEDCENEEEDDEGDVELIDSELKETDSTTKVDELELPPPAKRLRLSEDSVQSPKADENSNDPKEDNMFSKENEPIEDLEAKCSPDVSPSTLKRSRDVINLEGDEKSNDSKASNDSLHKKLRTAEMETDLKSTEATEDEKPSVDTKPEVDFKSDIKAVPSYQPIPLYPPPKFGTLKSEYSLKLDFLKKFRKSFDNMSKQDLEELVLQKVVEAIIHRSEFSEMRELIEKQEKLITAHRSKISELSKQFRDLEMVHNRVVKDIEQRNSQFIMPVKITRAVGLQVYIPNKKSIADAASSSNNTTSNSSSSPQRPLANQPPSVPSSTANPPQRQFMSSQTEAQQQRVPSSTSNANNNAGGIRRGCAQKITPIRPVPGNNQPPSAVSTVNPTIYRSTPNQSVSSQPRILNKNASQTTNAVNVQRSRYLGSNQDGQRAQAQQQVARSPNITASGQRVAPIATAQPKTASHTAAAVQRSSSTSSTNSIVDNYINTLTHLSGGNNTAVSITPAKPKEKAVIDLTDEDEAPSQTSSAQSAAQNPALYLQRRSLPGQNSSNSQLQYGRAAPPLARISPAPNNKNRQISTIQAQKNNNSFAAINTPAGTSITRINVSSNAANVQRVKYSHPAPLPATPPQAFNPAWKLPPPRPTIRISNLDNGIVISWTMEESMDRHAECVSYQIYAYQETSGPPMVDSWRHVGDVKAMLLPMAVTLTQFQEGQRYFFAVRAVDCHQRFGPFSLPKTWS